MNVQGNNNIVVGRDINILSDVQTDGYSGIPDSYRKELDSLLAQLKQSSEPKSVAVRYIQRITESTPVEVLSAIVKLIGKFI